MIARKENKVYSVTEENKAFYVNQGFDILDEDGKVLSYGKGKTVNYAEYEKLLAENQRLKKLLAAQAGESPVPDGIISAGDKESLTEEQTAEKATGHKARK